MIDIGGLILHVVVDLSAVLVGLGLCYLAWRRGWVK